VGNKTPNEKQLERLLNGMQPVMVVNPDGTEEVVVTPWSGHCRSTGRSDRVLQFKLRTGEVASRCRPTRC